MAKGYLDLVRTPSGKEVRVRADFFAMINETKNGTMIVLLDGNQVYVGDTFSDVQVWHEKASKELVELQTIYFVPASLAFTGSPPSPAAQTPSKMDEDNEIPF